MFSIITSYYKLKLSFHPNSFFSPDDPIMA